MSIDFENEVFSSNVNKTNEIEECINPKSIRCQLWQLHHGSKEGTIIYIIVIVALYILGLIIIFSNHYCDDLPILSNCTCNIQCPELSKKKKKKKVRKNITKSPDTVESVVSNMSEKNEPKSSEQSNTKHSRVNKASVNVLKTLEKVEEDVEKEMSSEANQKITTICVIETNIQT